MHVYMCVGLFTTKCSALGGQKRESDPEAVVTGDCAAPSVTSKLSPL